jgi:hypothetical protein
VVAVTPGTARNAASTPQKHPAAKVALSIDALPAFLTCHDPEQP